MIHHNPRMGEREEMTMGDSSTVFTPDALERSVARGAFKTARLGDFLKIDADEVFVFRFPSRNIVNRENGDGEYGSHLYTIEGYAKREREQAATAALSRLGLHVDHGSPLRGHVEALVEAALAIVPEMRAKLEGDDR
jgi:hypothetical protein